MKENLYWKALLTVIKNALEKPNYTRDDIKKMVFYGIKYTNTQRVDDIDTLEEVEDFHNFVMGVSDFIGYLTPSEFMNIFPVAKEYNGHKYECKDYFYTIEYLNTLERDKPIKEQSIDEGSVLGFLWEYHNWEVRRFTVTLTTSLSKLQMFQGQPTITDKLFDTLGFETHTLYESSGKQFLLDSDGRTTVVHKPLPRYLKQIK